MRNIFTLILILIIFSVFPLQAEWMKAFGDAGRDKEFPRCILQAEDGGFIVAGNTEKWGVSGGSLIVPYLLADFFLVSKAQQGRKY